MKLYLDTSAIVKLYVPEAGRDDVRRAIDSCDEVGTSAIAYAELRAATARAVRGGRLGATAGQKLAKSIDADWAGFTTVRLTDALIQRAGQLAEEHGLRGYDAVHLACALRLRARLREEVVFGCYDDELNAAARAEGFITL